MLSIRFIAAALLVGEKQGKASVLHAQDCIRLRFDVIRTLQMKASEIHGLGGFRGRALLWRTGTGCALRMAFGAIFEALEQVIRPRRTGQTKP